MAIDRWAGTDGVPETIDAHPPKKPHPPPDTPGAEGSPSRADSRKAASVANESAAGGPGGEDAVEGSVLDGLRKAVTRLDRRAEQAETPHIVERPDAPTTVVQDKKETAVRYGTPLDRPDGTRTPLFNGEPTREQTKQGRLNDCGIISTLGAVAGCDPKAIKECVRETDDGNYEVRLHDTEYSKTRMRYQPTGRRTTLLVTPDLPVLAAAPRKPAFADSQETGTAWAPVLEKAIAGLDQTWDRERREKWAERCAAQGKSGDPPGGYLRLDQGSFPIDRAELLTQLTGRPAKNHDFPSGYDINARGPDKQLLADLRQQLADGKPVLVGTRTAGENEPPLAKDLKDAHAYEMVSIDDQDRVHLRNPWNEFHPEPLTIGEFMANIRPRYTTLE
ncbi:C2 family cysteine protease [Actinoallomurus purpureus]|uniref:C2 family cysteine protease n=1 Tax=Actinoallomurus purpureus TaxID=478114 RepID=UPI002092FA85|nr:C2 family cysteine protease [Actinoallomurus purpureus]MCO6011027.1 C2 family cysteine protease [Actinoallomurus purpureus]